MAKAKVKVKGLDSSIGIGARRAIAYTVLILISILCLFWFYVLFVNATRSNSDLTRGFRPFPSTNAVANWKNMLNSSLPVVRGMLNSLIVAGCSAVVSTYFSTMTAYAIHAYDFKLRKFMFTFILMVMTIPTQVTALGFIDLMDKMKLEDSYIPLIIPTIAAPATFFYMKQYMESVLPMEIVDAARVDGSGEFYTFNRIILPMMKPALAVQLIFTFVQSWNNYFLPALLLDKAEMKTVPIMIAQLRSADYSKFDMGKVYMFILLAILPVMLVYIILSKSIIKGVTAGSVKG